MCDPTYQVVPAHPGHWAVFADPDGDASSASAVLFPVVGWARNGATFRPVFAGPAGAAEAGEGYPAIDRIADGRLLYVGVHSKEVPLDDPFGRAARKRQREQSERSMEDTG